MKNIKISKKFKLLALTTCMVFSPITINKDVYADNTSIVQNEKDDDISLLNLCNTYGAIYSIKPECILDYVEFKTNGYSDLIDNDWEKTVLYNAQELYYDSRLNGYYESITTGEPYEVTLSPEELVEKYSEIVDTNKYIGLTIGYVECGDPIEANGNYSYNGNIGGICSPSHFDNAEIGIIFFTTMLKNDYGVNKDSDESKFGEMASIYCPPNAYNWEHYLAIPIYNELKENGYYSRASEEVQKRANNKTKQK